MGKLLVWYRKRDDRWMLIGLWTVAALCAMAAGRHRERRTENKGEGTELAVGLSDIVSRLSLYMSAGMSTRKAWEKSWTIMKDGKEKEQEQLMRKCAGLCERCRAEFPRRQHMRDME